MSTDGHGASGGNLLSSEVLAVMCGGSAKSDAKTHDRGIKRWRVRNVNRDRELSVLYWGGCRLFVSELSVFVVRLGEGGWSPPICLLIIGFRCGEAWRIMHLMR